MRWCAAAEEPANSQHLQTEKTERRHKEIEIPQHSYLMIGSKPISSTIIFLVNDFEPRISGPLPPLSSGMEDIDREYEVVLHFNTFGTKNALVCSQPGDPRATAIATKACGWKRMC